MSLNFSIFICIALLFSSAGLFALPSDSEQNISYGCKNKKTDRVNEIITCNGEVTIEQGSIKAQSDGLIIETTQQGTNRLTMTGSPVFLQHQPKVDSPIIHIEGREIIYDDGSEILTITSDVKYDGGNGEEMKAGKIYYNLLTGNWDAEGVPGGTERVTGVLPSRKKTTETNTNNNSAE